ncbi:MAG: hypothetical protein QM820_47095 [Minicystis sp.]
MSGLTGSFFELDGLISKFKRMANVPKEAAKKAAPKLAAVAQAQWQAGLAPDGTSWPPNKDGSIPLTKLTSKIKFRASGESIVATGPDELQYHQEGGGNLPQRRVFPEEGAPLPPAWQKVLDDALTEEMKR